MVKMSVARCIDSGTTIAPPPIGKRVPYERWVVDDRRYRLYFGGDSLERWYFKNFFGKNVLIEGVGENSVIKWTTPWPIVTIIWPSEEITYVLIEREDGSRVWKEDVDVIIRQLEMKLER